MAARRAASTQPRAEAAPFHRLFFINLDRRPERRVRFERRAAAAGVGHLVARFPAVDGHALDLDAYPQSVVSARGLQSARAPPPMVNGVYLTRGALGLILSYHTLLQRIAADSQDRVYVVAEDDAVLGTDFCQRLGASLEALRATDPHWDLLHVGYYDDDCVLRGMEAEGAAAQLLCRPVQVFGLFGAALRPRGARALLEQLFPLDEQIDSALARVYHAMNAYAARPSIMKASHSTAQTTDIQILPESYQPCS